jgi:hypothetical protein
MTISLFYVMFILFTNDVTIYTELDPAIHIGNTWFILETGVTRKIL